MGKTLSSLVTTQCNYCQGTGHEPNDRSTYCKGCKGCTYLSVFRLPECLQPENHRKYMKVYIDKTY